MTRLLRLLLLALLLSGCAGTPEPPATLRQALLSLGERAAETVLATPAWSGSSDDIVLLLAPVEVAPELGIDATRFGENLSRALLAREQGPQLLDWMPTLASETAPTNHWLLESRLAADGPALQLSDRRLLPYRLTLRLRHPGETAPRWERRIDGAIDTTAL